MRTGLVVVSVEAQMIVGERIAIFDAGRFKGAL